MQGVVITSIGWERVLLTLHGRVELASGRPGPGSFYLRLRDTEEMVPLPKVSFEGDRFEITINITQAVGRYPLPTGEWLLCWADADGTEQPTFMATPFPVDAADYGGLFLVRSGQYWMMPARDRLTSHFFINVNDRSQLPPEVVRRRRSFNAIKRDFRTTIFRAVYELTRRLVRKTGRRVLFASDSRAELSGNLKCIHDRMIERGLDGEYELMTAFKEAVIARRGLLDKFTFPITVAKADFIIIDDLHPMLYKVDYDEHVRIIQTWHASGSFKTFGYSRLGTQGAPAPFSKWHRNYTHAIASSTFDVPLYAEAFSMPEELVLPTGVPRMDLFLDPARQEAHREAVYEVYPQIRDKKIILFAPTFRGAVYRVAYYDFDRIDMAGLYELAEEQDAVVIFKIHPLVRNQLADSRAVRGPLLRRDAEPRDQRLPARRRPRDHRLLVARVRVRRHRLPHALLRLRPRRVHRRARLLHALRGVRPRQDRPHLRRAARRHPNRGLRSREDRALRQAAFRPSRRRLERPRDRPAHLGRVGGRDRTGAQVGAASGLHGLFGASRARAGRLGVEPLHTAAWQPQVHPRGAASARASESQTVLLLSDTRPGLLGKASTLLKAIVAEYYLATSRVFIVDDYFFPIYVITPKPGTTIIQTWHASGAFKKIGYSVLDKSFGASEELVRHVRIHSNYDHILIGSKSAIPAYSEAFGQPAEKFVTELGIPRTDLFFDTERDGRGGRGRSREVPAPLRQEGPAVRADVSRRLQARGRLPRRPGPGARPRAVR